MKSVRQGMQIWAAALLLSQPAWAESSVSNQWLKEMAAPITHPTVFEDPRATSELRLIHVYHKISEDFVTNGGAASIFALQARYAVNDRLSILATKDGYVHLKTDEVLRDEDGWADVGIGAKYAVLFNPEQKEIVTVGFRFDLPVGSEEVFQGQGDGSYNPFVSAAFGIGDFNIMAGTGVRLAVDDEDSSFFDFSLHADTKLGWFHPVVEFHATNVLDAGKRLPIADEGEDFFNFGASESDGKTLVSAAVGGRVDLTDSLTFGVAYQFPLSDGAGSNILEGRVTTDLIYRF